MATEEATYILVKKEGEFEIRDYESHILAEIIVEGSLEDAGSKAFNSLFRYISGDNHLRNKLAMIAPVSQEPLGQKINMTAPVEQQRIGNQWAVSFMMPAVYTLETLPEPDNSKIRLRQIPARRIAAVRYSGFWNEKSYSQYKLALASWIHKNDLTVVGHPIWARYNSPFTPWFLRRNEILIPVM
jgi:effector-binding domain-containing protein